MMYAPELKLTPNNATTKVQPERVQPTKQQIAQFLQNVQLEAALASTNSDRNVSGTDQEARQWASIADNDEVAGPSRGEIPDREPDQNWMDETSETATKMNIEAE